MGYDMTTKGSGEYFRANIFGMSDLLRPLMRQFGMVVDTDEEDDFDLEAHYASKPGIPLHKLCSNDGWLITEDEIKDALTTYRALPLKDIDNALATQGPENAEWFKEWIEYLDRASKDGGIEVY